MFSLLASVTTTQRRPLLQASALGDSLPKLAPVSIKEPTDSMNEKDVLTTMEDLMFSMSSGDWTRIMPDDFYSLIDNLQDMKGLNQSEIDLLEESYTKYLKSQSTFNYLEQNDFELQPNPMFNTNSISSPSVGSNYSNHSSPHHSPHLSPVSTQNILQPTHVLSNNHSNHNNNNNMVMNSNHSRSPTPNSCSNSFNAAFIGNSSFDDALKVGAFTNMNNIQSNSNRNTNNLDISSINMMASGGSEINNNNKMTLSPRLDNSTLSTPRIEMNMSVSRDKNSMNMPSKSDLSNHCYAQRPSVQTMRNVPSYSNMIQNVQHAYHTNNNNNSVQKTNGVEDEEDDFDWSTIL